MVGLRHDRTSMIQGVFRIECWTGRDVCNRLATQSTDVHVKR